MPQHDGADQHLGSKSVSDDLDHDFGIDRVNHSIDDLHLLMSNGGSIWKDFMERNRDEYTMYAITPAGYEGTMPPPWSETSDFSDRVWTDALCKAVASLIEREKLDRPIIVGHHMLGDHYALRIALDHLQPSFQSGCNRRTGSSAGNGIGKANR